MATVVGITGGIATGKSTVLRLLGELGAETMSADEVAHEVLSKGTPAYAEVVARFGPDVLGPDGEIDRAALGRIVFSDAAARADLEAITHPRIIARIEDMVREFRAAHPMREAVLAVEIPLLIECGMQSMVDEVLLVAAEQETQVSRLTSSRNLARDEALRRIASQMPLQYKAEFADRVIRNDGDLSSLKSAVRRAWSEILLP